MTSTLRTVVPVWAAVAVAAILIGVIVPSGDHVQAIMMAMAGGVLLSFGIQLAFGRSEGTVDRLMLSSGGAIVILAVATLVLGLISLA